MESGFIFDDDEAEKTFLSQPPVSFLVVGKPCVGKTTLARAVSSLWSCKLIAPDALVSELLACKDGTTDAEQTGEEADLELFHFEASLQRERAELARGCLSGLLEGGCIEEQAVYELLMRQLSSEETAHYGYVLDGLPCWGSASWRSVSEQITAIMELPLKPDFIIHVRISDDDAKLVYSHLRVSPCSGAVFSRRFHSPCEYALRRKLPLPTHRPTDPDAGSQDSESELGAADDASAQSEEGDANAIFDFSFLNLDPEEGRGALVSRPEDGDPQQIVSAFRESSLSALEGLMALYGKNRIIEIDALASPEQMLQSVTDQLACFSIQPSMVPQLLFPPEEDADDLDTMDDEEFLSHLRSTNPLHPNCRWKISRWGRFCPVALKSGKMIPGKQQFSVSFLDKLYCLSSQRAVQLFLRCPRKFLLPPQPMLPCKLAVVGPPLSGASALAAELSRYTDAVAVDPRQLVSPLLAREKEQRADAAEEQAKVNALAALHSQLSNQLKTENASEEQTERELGSLDTSHPDVQRAGLAARQEVLDTDLQATGTMYVSAIAEVLARLREARREEGHAPEGGWVLDGVPCDLEQWGLLTDAAILPEHVISLSDPSEEGRFLMLRHAAALGMPDPYKPVPDNLAPPPEPIAREQSIEQIIAAKEKAEKAEQSEEFSLPPALEEFQQKRQAYDRNWQKLTATLKGANVPVISVNCHLTTEAMRMECMKQLEKVFCYKPYDYPPRDTEDGDADPIDPQLTPLELGLANRDSELEEAVEEKTALEAKPWGDTNQFCPVSLVQSNVLAPGKEDLGVRYRERVYSFASQEAKDAFSIAPDAFIATNGPLQPPPIRVFILGPRYSGKTTAGAKIAEKLGLFFVSFPEWIQEKVMHKLHRKPPLVDEEDLESPGADKPVESPTDENKEEQLIGNQLSEELDATEEAIRSNLTERAPLPEDVLEWVKQFWLEDPYKSTGFVLEGFPRTNEEAQFLINSGLFPDSIVMLSVSDEDVINRVMPAKLEILTRKQQKEKEDYEKKLARKADTLKRKIESRERELREEFSQRRKQAQEEHRGKKGTDDETDEDDLQTELDALEEEQKEKLQEGREEEEGGQSETEELEQEPFEDARERMRTAIIDKYEAEMDGYREVQELMGEASVAWHSVEGSRKPNSVLRGIEAFLRPAVQFRHSMLTKVIPIDLGLAHILVKSRYKQLTKFGWWCPVQLYDGVNTPPLSIASAAIYRSYVIFFSSTKARSRFKSDPFLFLGAAAPGPLVPVQVAVLGPPRSGKTALSERIGREYGCLAVSAGGAIRRVLREQHWSALAQALESKLRAGEDIPVEYIVKAIESSLMQPSVVRRGFVLDSFPVTLSQVAQLAEHRILPGKILELECSVSESVRRAGNNPKVSNAESPLPFHESADAITETYGCYSDNIGEVRSHYSDKYHNYDGIDAEKSQWNVWSHAKKGIDQNFKQIQCYIESQSLDTPARLRGLCITRQEFEEKLGEFLHYCPVSLVVEGALVDCEEDVVYQFGVEYQSKRYLFADERALSVFMSDPDRFVTQEARALLPVDRPHKLTRSQVKSRFPQQVELKSYCPVSYVESGQCYEGLVTGEMEFVAEYKQKLYAMATEEKRDSFMRFPVMFSDVTLPAKLPPLNVSLPLNRLPMLGYLEQTVSVTLQKSLTALGEFKPKFPFVSPSVSAQIFLALHLKAYNPRSSEHIKNKYKQKLARFETHCSLVNYLGMHMGPRRTPVEELPRDFDDKLNSFFSFQTTHAK